MIKVSTDETPTMPESIDILGKQFQIIKLHEDDKDHQDVSGQMELHCQKIWVKEYSGADVNKDTLLHETVHAIEEILHLKMKENQVHQLSAGLMAVLKQNKELTKWLFH